MKTLKKLSLLGLMVSSLGLLVACGDTTETTNEAEVTKAPTATEEPTPSPTPELSAEEKLSKYFEAVSEPIKIMEWGDSITAGLDNEGDNMFGGYRTYLNDKIEAAGYSEKIDFVGQWSTGGGYDKDNSGTIGATIAYDYWAQSMATDLAQGIIENNDPDIIMFQIGTNDFLNKDKGDEEELLDITKINDRIDSLVDDILEKLGDDGVLFIASIPPLGEESYADDNPLIVDYNNHIKDYVGTLSAEGKNIYFVDVYAILTPADLADEIHPTQDGYSKMADLWYDTLMEYFAGLYTE